MNLTGGLHWHWRAWRAQARWAQTRTEIETWLLAQPVPTDHLLLIGASAGWMMSTPWLQRYQSVQTWDIDPMAGPLFRWRHGRALKARGVRLACHTGDALSQLPQLLRDQPQLTVFFDNVLGQIRFQNASVEHTQQRLSSIKQTLRDDTGAACTTACPGLWPRPGRSTDCLAQGTPRRVQATKRYRRNNG